MAVPIVSSIVRRLGALVIVVAWTGGATAGDFDFKKVLFDSPSTLGISVQSIDPVSGQMTVNGGDSQCPTTPFTWDWGDGTAPESAWFPAAHTYADPTRNYVVTVTAHYGGGETDSTQAVGWFAAPPVSPVGLPPETAVTIPEVDVSLESRMPGYTPPASLTHFDDVHFGAISRETIEYVLSVGASVENDLARGNVADVDGGFNQVVLRDGNLSGGGMYSLWYTTPVAFGAAGQSMQGSVQWSSFLHEMGHNVTLNSPADYYYGGKIDGCANAIFSESMAQIFQHATAYEMIHHADAYGLGDDLACDLGNCATSSMKIVRSAYESYLAGGSHFHSWNDPATGEDETFNTFMTIAYKFFEHAENGDDGYRGPLWRMMRLLQMFDEDLENRYDRHHDTADADAFRATLMVTAVSYGFDADLRSEFEALNFPIDDATYEELMAKVVRLLPGDATDDGVVDDEDAAALAAHWGESDADWAMGDFDDDGVVGPADASILAAHWGYGTSEASGAPLPEPGAIVLLLGAMAGLAVVRFR